MTFLYRPGHPKANERGMINAKDLGDWDETGPLAINAGIMAGRFHENSKAPDGTDISTRSKFRAWMKATGNTYASDYSEGFRERLRGYEAREYDRKLESDIERTAQEIEGGKYRERRQVIEFDGRAHVLHRKG